MECSICLDDINKKTMKILPCKHIFHKKCINRWLKNSIQCPLCKSFLENEFKVHFCKNKSKKKFKYTKLIIILSIIIKRLLDQ